MSASSRPFCINAVLRNTVLAVLRTTESDSTDKTPIAFSISSCVVRGLPRVKVLLWLRPSFHRLLSLVSTGLDRVQLPWHAIALAEAAASDLCLIRPSVL